ncbi:hypothetical protein H2549_005149, partial [Salmonella enterica subsp. enterica serovar Stanley]|nr:hypothetical protein [Salmonella enterica subsp. enterica serovar Stanley]
MAESTNLLAAMKLKKLTGFKQITPGVITGNVITVLKQCGIDAVTGYSIANSEFSVGSMSVLGNTFYGLKVSTPAGRKSIGSLALTLTEDTGDLKNKAIQVGFRLTQSALNAPDTQLFNFFAGYDLSANAPVNNEDASAYYETVITAENTQYYKPGIVARVYVNRQLIAMNACPYYAGKPVLLRIPGGNLLTDMNAGFSYMTGDMYVAELDYNSDGTVTPQLLGNLTLEPFTVASYSGDKHSNTKNQDIVTALNTLDPNNDMGVLSIKPVEQPASITFNAPDVAGKSILGASLNIVYKDSIAPNN